MGAATAHIEPARCVRKNAAHIAHCTSHTRAHTQSRLMWASAPAEAQRGQVFAAGPRVWEPALAHVECDYVTHRRVASARMRVYLCVCVCALARVSAHTAPQQQQQPPKVDRIRHRSASTSGLRARLLVACCSLCCCCCCCFVALMRASWRAAIDGLRRRRRRRRATTAKIAAARADAARVFVFTSPLLFGNAGCCYHRSTQQCT